MCVTVVIRPTSEKREGGREGGREGERERTSSLVSLQLKMLLC